MHTIKSQTKLFKNEETAINTLPRDQQNVTLRNKRAEQGAKLAELEEQFRHSVLVMTEEQTVQLEKEHREQRAAQQRDHELALRQLNEFQLYRQENIRDRHTKEIAKLYEDIAAMQKEARDYEAAEVFRCGVEAERITKAREAMAKELAAQQSVAAVPFVFRSS